MSCALFLGCRVGECFIISILRCGSAAAGKRLDIDYVASGASCGAIVKANAACAHIGETQRVLEGRGCTPEHPEVSVDGATVNDFDKCIPVVRVLERESARHVRAKGNDLSLSHSIAITPVELSLEAATVEAQCCRARRASTLCSRGGWQAYG